MSITNGSFRLGSSTALSRNFFVPVNSSGRERASCILPVEASDASGKSLALPVKKQPKALGLALLGAITLGSVSMAAPEAFAQSYEGLSSSSYGASMETLPAPGNILRPLPENTNQEILVLPSGNLVFSPDINREELKRGVENHPALVLDGIIRYYKQKPYAQAVMEAIAKKIPDYTLLRASEFQEEPYAAEIVRQAVTHALASWDEKWVVLEYAYRFKDQPYAPGAIKDAVMWAKEKAPGKVLRHAGSFSKEPYAESVIKEAAYVAVRKDPVAVLRSSGVLKGQPYAADVIGKAAIQEPYMALAYVDYFKDQPYALPIIYSAAERVVETNPRFVLENGNTFKGHPGAKAIMQRAVEKLLKKNMQSDLLINSDRFAKEPYAEQVINKAAATLPGITLEEAHRFAEEPYGAAIIQKTLKNALLLNDRRAIRGYARVVNHLHDSPEEIRFGGVKDVAAGELYTIIMEGEEDLFTSSFNGLFDRLLIAMAKENLNGEELLARAEETTFRSFIKLCANYNRLNEFLETMDSGARQQLLERFAKGIDKEKDPVSQAVVVADVFGIIEDPGIIKVFQETIRMEYKRLQQEQNKEGKVLYGLLTGMFAEKNIGDKQWVDEIAKKFKIPNLNTIPSAKLFTPEGLHVQRHFFYNDKDGEASFKSFMAQYKADPVWTVESHETFVRIAGSRNGKRIEIYANLPSQEKEGEEKIEQMLNERQITPPVVVHRGHSYHAQKTLKRIPRGTQLVYLGSCGGYNNVAAALEKSPEAHIISTKSKGTMFVNDPLLKMINESMLTSDSLNWQTVWADAEARLGKNPEFRHYISPPKNLGVLFLKAYKNVLSSGNVEQGDTAY